MQSIKTLISIGVYLFRLMRVTSKTNFILSRTACLGNDIIKALGLQPKTYNYQKCRIDLLVRSIEEKNKSLLGFILVTLKKLSHISNPDVNNLIMQQHNLQFWKNRNVTAIIFDTFSELTDQRFILKHDNIDFFCYFSDVNAKSIQTGVLECKGLITESELEYYWNVFLRQAKKQFGNIRVYVIEFPSLKEERRRYLEQAKIIRNVMKRLEQDNSMFVFVQLDDNYQVTQNDWLDPNRYHYSAQTKMLLGSYLQREMAIGQNY